MYSFHFITILTFALAASLHAAPSVVVSLTSVGDRVRAQNPDLAAARLRIREALGRMNQAGRLENPELETSLQHNPSFRERGVEIGFSQRFPVTERLRLEKEVTLNEYRASEAEVREVERRIIAEAREAVVKVIAIRQQRQLLDEQAALAKEFATFLSDIAAKGEGSPLDAGQAKLEAASLAVEMRQLAAAEAAAAGSLKPLLGMRLGESLLVSGTLPPPMIPTARSNPSRRPDFQAAKLEVTAAENSVMLEQAKRYDDVEGGFFAAVERTEDAPDGYDREAVVGLRFKITLPFWDRNEGAIEEAAARKKRKELEARALARSIHLEADAARAEMSEWKKLLDDLNETLIPLADEQAKATEAAFRQGQAEIREVFLTREKRLKLSVTRLDSLREFHLARVRYESSLGSR
jgi:outer membrane protein, heavy metal efflux system